MAGGYQPLACPALNEPLRKHLPPHVVGDAHDGHDGENGEQRADMDRHEQHEQRNDDGAGQRFPRVEAHGGPGGRRVAGVVDGVGDAVDRGPVHPAMGPVEPCVVEREVGEHRGWEPPQGIVGHVGVDAGPAMLLPPPRDDAGGDAVKESGRQRPADFAADLRTHAGVETGLLDPRQQRETAASQEVAQPHNRRHGEGGGDHGPEP